MKANETVPLTPCTHYQSTAQCKDYVQCTPPLPVCMYVESTAISSYTRSGGVLVTA